MVSGKRIQNASTAMADYQTSNDTLSLLSHESFYNKKHIPCIFRKVWNSETVKDLNLDFLFYLHIDKNANLIYSAPN